jgi:hypothetical protein
MDQLSVERLVGCKQIHQFPQIKVVDGLLVFFEKTLDVVVNIGTL